VDRLGHLLLTIARASGECRTRYRAWSWSSQQRHTYSRLAYIQSAHGAVERKHPLIAFPTRPESDEPRRSGFPTAVLVAYELTDSTLFDAAAVARQPSLLAPPFALNSGMRWVAGLTHGRHGQATAIHSAERRAL
jgi:hypothetical protein